MSRFEKYIIVLAFTFIIGGIGVCIWGGLTAEANASFQRMICGIGILVMGIFFMHLGTES